MGVVEAAVADAFTGEFEAGEGACRPALTAQPRSRRTYFSTLPVAFSGRASTTSTERGTL